MYALSNETHYCGQGQKVIIRISLFQGPRCNVQISWKLMQLTRGEWGRPSVTVIWASQRFGHPHSQNPSDTGIPFNPNPNPNPHRYGNMKMWCLYHWDFGNGDAHITATSPIQPRPHDFSLRKLKNPGERLPPLPFAQITRLIFFWPCFREVPTIWGLQQAKPELTCNFFSTGQRLTLLEEKLVLAHVLRHFKIQSTQSYDELQLCSELILRPKEGVFVTLTERQ